VDALADQLADRQNEVAAMQESIMSISSSMNSFNTEDDSDLWQELDALMHADEPKQHDVAPMPTAPMRQETTAPMRQETAAPTAPMHPEIISFDPEPIAA
jgi:hypothetical protein